MIITRTQVYRQATLHHSLMFWEITVDGVLIRADDFDELCSKIEKHADNIVPISNTYDPGTCQHNPHEDCMNCIECGECREDLDSTGLCIDCGGVEDDPR